MEYEGQICRAPMERSSYMLPVMVGCSYNRCRFCTLFKHLKFRKLPLAQVEHDLIRVKEAGGKPKAVFLGDGNAFDLPTEELAESLKLVRKYFPEGPSVRMDATVTGILAKSPEELEQLHSLGVEHLYWSGRGACFYEKRSYDFSGGKGNCKNTGRRYCI